jgi:exodeoxyribonuclease-1
MKFCQALSALQPGALIVPTGANGRLTYKLDQLAPANGFDHANAHDALADVEATVHICRRLRDCADDHWSNALRFSQKAAAAAFMEEEPAFIITECYFGLPYQFALTKIGVDADNASRVLAYDLEVNPAELRPLTLEALTARLGRKIKPLRRVRTNASPILHEVDSVPSFHGLSPDQLIQRAEDVRGDPNLCARICEAGRRAAKEESAHVEQQIYGTFSGDADKERMIQFHASDWGQRALIAETFEDQRLVELGRRLVFHHEPAALRSSARANLASFFACRMTGHGHADVAWTTLSIADAEAVALLGSCCEEEAAIVHSLRAYIASQRDGCEPYLS